MPAEPKKAIIDPKLSDDEKDEPFMADLLRRSKALDQKELALLAGCKAEQVSWVRNEGDLSVLTYFLIEQLKDGDDALTVKEAFERMKKPLTAYLIRSKREQTPVLIDQLTPPFYLRPGKGK